MDDQEQTQASDDKFPIKTRFLYRTLDVKLSDKDVNQNAHRAASLRSTIQTKTEEMDNARKIAKAKIEELESEQTRLLLEISVGFRAGEVKCEERFVYRDGSVVIVRLDTKEEIDSRPMTDRERQVDLDLPDPAARAAAAENARIAAGDESEEGESAEGESDDDDEIEGDDDDGEEESDDDDSEEEEESRAGDPKENDDGAVVDDNYTGKQEAAAPVLRTRKKAPAKKAAKKAPAKKKTATKKK